jgi:seryl-tRNA synthetase
LIDLKAARADPERVRPGIARKGGAEAFDELLAADERWRELVPQVDELRGRQKLKGKPTPEQVEELKTVKEDLRRLEEELSAAEAARDELLQKVPNPAHESVPDDAQDDSEGEIVREGGERPQLYEPKEHLELGRFEMERGARLSGSRFGYIVGDTARLALALYRWALDRAVAAGFTPVIPPVLVREEAMYGTGFFPAERFEVYEVVDEGLYLTGTSEVALAGRTWARSSTATSAAPLHGVLDQLPPRGGGQPRHARDVPASTSSTKVEAVRLRAARGVVGRARRLLAIEESLAQELGLPYRVVNIGASELSAAAAKRYDLEAWFPSQQRYRELTSASNTTDYQSRRLGIRYRANGHTEYVHTLNGTAVTDRWALAVLENFQGEVPEVLQQFGAPARIES